MDEPKFAAPYVPFPTFETSLNHLAALGAIPPKIDHSVFPSMGGIAKGQSISAFKFLGLIDANGVPQKSLEELVLKKESRKTILRAILKERYSNIKETDLSSMSSGQLDAKLSDDMYNVSGATRLKAKAFLLKAAEFCDVPLSRLLTTKGPRGPRKKRPQNTKNSESQQTVQEKQFQQTPPQNPNVIRMPVPLGPGRLANIELPNDWDAKELPKLLALLKLSLGGDAG